MPLMPSILQWMIDDRLHNFNIFFIHFFSFTFFAVKSAVESGDIL